MDWKGIVGAIAPILATALGGPLAGAATKVLSEKLLGRADGTDKEIRDAVIAADPVVLAKVKEAEMAFTAKMEELGVDLERLHAQDRQSARAREVALGIVASLGIHILAFMILSGFLATVWWVLTGDLPQDPLKIGLVGTVIGYMSAKADQVIAYFFGSSAGSKAKTDAMAKAMADTAHR
jgi:hypothetical protein